MAFSKTPAAPSAANTRAKLEGLWTEGPSVVPQVIDLAPAALIQQLWYSACSAGCPLPRKDYLQDRGIWAKWFFRSRRVYDPENTYQRMVHTVQVIHALEYFKKCSYFPYTYEELRTKGTLYVIFKVLNIRPKRRRRPKQPAVEVTSTDPNAWIRSSVQTDEQVARVREARRQEADDLMKKLTVTPPVRSFIRSNREMVGTVCDKCKQKRTMTSVYQQQYGAGIVRLPQGHGPDKERRYWSVWLDCQSGRYDGRMLHEKHGTMANNHRRFVADKAFNKGHPLSCGCTGLAGRRKAALGLKMTLPRQ